MVRDEYNHSRPVSALIRDWLLYNKAGGGGGIMKTVTGNPISISDALAAPIQSLSVSLSPIQEGSGDPSPDNIRPITGRTEVTVERTGKNLLNPDFSAFTLVGTYRAQKMPDTGFTLSIKDKGNGADISGIYFGITEYGINANGYVAWLIQNGTIKFTEKYTSAYRYVTIYPTGQASLDKLLARFDIQAEFNTAASAYEPYDGQSATVQLGQTVYGGKVDVTTGKATIAWKKYIGSAFASASARTGGFYARMNLGVACAGGQITPALYACNRAVYGGNRYDKWYFYAAGNAGTLVNYVHMYIPESAIDYHEGDNITSLLNAAYNASDFEFILPVPEPFTIDLTPASLSTLRGDNTVWSDGDDISMTYKAVSS